MKTLAILIAFAVTFASSAFADEKHEHAHEHEPMHGGVVVESGDLDYELVIKPDVVQLYLRDHGEAVNITNASAKVMLLAGKERQEAELRPAGDKLQATGSFNAGPGTKAVAVVSIDGKLVGTVRFAIK